MQAIAFAIADRHREHDNQVVKSGDFTLVQEGACDVRRVLDDPSCTLYCLDPEKRQALFVETPPHLELYDAPFLYQAQFQNARRVFAITYEDLRAATDERADPPAGLGLLYSVGRCGSTLLGRALHALPGVHSLAEPDVLTQCIGAPPDEAQVLLKSCVRALCRPGGRERAPYYVLKLRHLGIKLGGVFPRVFPDSRALFVYRNAVDMVVSSLRAFHPQLLPYPEYRADPVRFVARQWLSVMQHYLKLHRSGVLIRAVRYEDLIQSPQELFAAICSHYGLAIPAFSAVEAIFSADAQAGSNLSRENLGRTSLREIGTDEEIAQRVRDTLAGHPELSRPDAVVPGTLSARP